MRILTIIATALLCFLSARSQVNIWEGTEVHKQVMLTPYLASGENCTAIVVCPGGSYFWHDIETEGHLVARWLQANGISAFVLKYRTGGLSAFITHFRLVFRGNRYPDPQNDLRRAIRYLKQHAQDYRININRIGAMGFSAGGHLVMSALELFDKDDWPAFVASIYPVVTMTHECVHKRSRRGLLGDSKAKDKALCDLLSLERHIPNDCPPVFLVNCKDDPIVDYRNSELLDSALTAQNVSHVYIQYKSGGHGFGTSDIKGTEECRLWKKDFLEWIKQLYNL